MFVSLQFKLELKRGDKEKLIKLMRKQSSGRNPKKGRVEKNYPSKCFASSEGSPIFPYFRKSLTERPFSSEAIVGARGVG